MFYFTFPMWFIIGKPNFISPVMATEFQIPTLNSLLEISKNKNEVLRKSLSYFPLKHLACKEQLLQLV